MGWTKGQFITQAFDELGLASYVFDLQPDQLQTALARLDTMMASWNALGIRLGYPLGSSPDDNDLDQQTNVPDSANEAIYTNLAIKLAPSFGKQVSADTRLSARTSYNTLLSKAAMPMEQQFPAFMVAGAAYKRTQAPFLNQPVDPLLAGGDELVLE